MAWVRQCVKPLGDSSFQGLFVHQAIEDSKFQRQAIGGF